MVQICHLMVQKCRMGVHSLAGQKFTSRLGNRRKLAKIMAPSGNCLSKRPGKSPGVQKYPPKIGKRRSASGRSLGKSIENRSALRNKPSKIGKIASHREMIVAGADVGWPDWTISGLMPSAESLHLRAWSARLGWRAAGAPREDFAGPV